jgi:hypothetical protein
MINKNHIKNEKNNIIEIIADYIYFVITGEKKELEELKLKLEEHDSESKYLICRLDIPISFRFNKIQKLHNQKLTIDMGIESAQSYALAQEQFIFYKFMNKKKIDLHVDDLKPKYMLMQVNENILRFPKLELNDEDEPEKLIMEWINNKNINNNNLKKTIKPISLVGFDNEILVYTAIV